MAKKKEVDKKVTKKEKIQKYSIWSNLIVSIILVIINIIMVGQAQKEMSSSWATNLWQLFFLFIILSNIFVFVYLLAKRKKQLYLMQIIFLIIPIIAICISAFLPSMVGIYATFAVAYFILLIVSLYYLWKK
jgi:cytochrome bd-type quinol oxidase subunit 2